MSYKDLEKKAGSAKGQSDPQKPSAPKPATNAKPAQKPQKKS